MRTVRAARVIVRGIHGRGREVFVTGHGHVLVFLYRHAPSLVEFIRQPD